MQDRISAGVNLVRVLGMVDSFEHFYPQEHPEYYTRLRPFADMLASRGLRMEFVPFADALIIMPSESQREEHANRVIEALAHHPAVFIEPANEPGHGDQISEEEAHTLGLRMQGQGIPIATSIWAESIPEGTTAVPTLDFGTHHPDRGDEWPRFCRALDEVCKGWGWPDGTSFAGLHVPMVGDEPMGAAETDQPGRRSNVPSDFREYANGCALMGAGATFHSDDGIDSVVWGPKQRECALAFFAGLSYVPVECQLAPYQRGGAGGGSGVGNMPIVHYDLNENTDPGALRSYAKLDKDGNEYALAIRATVPDLVPRDGWRLVEQPFRGIGKLTR